MGDKRTFVPDGKYPELTITVSAKPTSSKELFIRRSAPNQAGISPYSPFDDPPPQDALKGISFYDLATRMRSVDPVTVSGLEFRPFNSPDVPSQHEGYVTEFVEIEFERVGTYPVNPETEPPAHVVGLTGADYTWFNNALLGSRAPTGSDMLDPFSFAPVNGSGRMIPVCMEISHAVMGVHAADVGDPADFPFSFKKGQVNDLWMQPLNKVKIFGNPLTGVRAYYDVAGTKAVIWKDYNPVLEDEINADERWSSIASMMGLDKHAKAKTRKVTVTENTGIAFGDYVGDGFGNLVIEIQGEFAGGVPGGKLVFGYGYEGFSTTDTDTFKITNEPRFDAAVVSFRVKGQDNRVYLRPTLIGFNWAKLVAGGGGSQRDVYKVWASRVPIYPFNGAPVTFPPGHEFNCYIHRSTIADYSHIPVDYRNIFLAPAVSLNIGSLVGAIGQGNKIFYIWRKIARDPDNVYNLGVNAGSHSVGACTL